MKRRCVRENLNTSEIGEVLKIQRKYNKLSAKRSALESLLKGNVSVAQGLDYLKYRLALTKRTYNAYMHKYEVFVSLEPVNERLQGRAIQHHRIVTRLYKHRKQALLQTIHKVKQKSRNNQLNRSSDFESSNSNLDGETEIPKSPRLTGKQLTISSSTGDWPTPSVTSCECATEQSTASSNFAPENPIIPAATKGDVTIAETDSATALILSIKNVLKQAEATRRKGVLGTPTATSCPDLFRSTIVTNSDTLTSREISSRKFSSPKGKDGDARSNNCSSPPPNSEIQKLQHRQDTAQCLNSFDDCKTNNEDCDNRTASDDAPLLGDEPTSSQSQLLNFSNRTGATISQSEQAQLVTNAIQPGQAKMELPKFDGDTLVYAAFIHQFDNLYPAQLYNSLSRYIYLQQHLVGKPYDKIKGLANKPNCYEAARERLDAEYRNNTFALNRMITAVVNGSAIRRDNLQDWESFMTELEQYENWLSADDQFGDLDNRTHLESIGKRLPNHEFREWIALYSDITNQNRRPRFADLFQLVRKQYRNVKLHAEQKKDHTLDQNSLIKSKRRSLDNLKQNQARDKTEQNGRPNDIVKKGLRNVQQRKACILCEDTGHGMHSCTRFLQLSQTERFQIIKDKRACTNCLKPGHGRDTCKSESSCKTCSKRHNTLLHRDMKIDKAEKQIRLPQSKVNLTSLSKTNSVECNIYTPKYRPIIPVKITSPTGIAQETYMLLDPGSEISFCSQRLADSLKLLQTPVRYGIKTMTTPGYISGAAVDLIISDLNEESSIAVRRMLVYPEIDAKPNDYPIEIDTGKYPHLEGISLPKLENNHVDLLIGADIPLAHISEVKRSVNCNTTAQYCIFGWTLFGEAIENTQSDTELNCNLTSVLESVATRMQILGKIDFADFSVAQGRSMSKDDRYALSLMQKNIKFVNGRYEVPLLWKAGAPNLANNKALAIKRFEQLEKKLKKNPNYLARYNVEVQKLLDRDFAERVPLAELKGPENRCWWLPHRGIFSEEKNKL